MSLPDRSSSLRKAVTLHLVTATIADAILKQNKVDSWYCERGGGIRILFLDHYCRNCSVTLENNTLVGNHAVYGGGAFIYVSGTTSNSTLKMFNNSFIANTASADGGGLEVSYATHENQHPINNTCIVRSSSFISNTATNGGGLSTYSSSLEDFKHRYNTLKCIKCHFERNFAHSGAAVSASRGKFSKDKMKTITRVYCYECVFKNNVVISKPIMQLEIIMAHSSFLKCKLILQAQLISQETMARLCILIQPVI